MVKSTFDKMHYGDDKEHYLVGSEVCLLYQPSIFLKLFNHYLNAESGVFCQLISYICAIAKNIQIKPVFSRVLPSIYDATTWLNRFAV